MDENQNNRPDVEQADRDDAATRWAWIVRAREVAARAVVNRPGDDEDIARAIVMTDKDT